MQAKAVNSTDLNSINESLAEVINAFQSSNEPHYSPSHPNLRSLVKTIFDLISFKLDTTNRYQTTWSHIEQKMVGSPEVAYLANSSTIKEVKEKIVSMIIFQIDKRKLCDFVGTIAPIVVTRAEEWKQLAKQLMEIDELKILIDSKILKSFQEFSKPFKGHDSLSADLEPVKQIKLIDEESLRKKKPNFVLSGGTPKSLNSPSSPNNGNTPYFPPKLSRADSPDFVESPMSRLDNEQSFQKNSTRLYQEEFEKVLQKYSYMPKPDITCMTVDFDHQAIEENLQLLPQRYRRLDQLRKQFSPSSIGNSVTSPAPGIALIVWHPTP